MSYEGDETELVQRLNNTRKKADNFSTALKLVQHDLEAIQDGFTINFAIDYSEVHRYLHSRLDRTSRTDPERYRFEQSVLRYIFEKWEENLLLLDVYYGEFFSRLARMRKDYYTLLTSHEIGDREKDLLATIKLMREGSELTDDVRNKFSNYALDLLIRRNVEESLWKGMEKFRELYLKGKIYFIHEKPLIDSRIVIAGDDQEFRDISKLMKAARPEIDRLQTNRNDAIAALMVKRLTEKNCTNKQIFTLISASFRIEVVFMAVHNSYVCCGERTERPILRNLTYVLLRYYYSGWSFDQVIKHIQEYESDLVKYRRLLARASYEALSLSSSKLVAFHKKIADYLWEFESTFLDKFSIKLNGPQPEEETIKTVVSLLRDRRKFREGVQHAFLALSDSIRKLEELMTISFAPKEEAV